VQPLWSADSASTRNKFPLLTARTLQRNLDRIHQKSGRVEGLFVGAVARDDNYLFRMFLHFVNSTSFRIMFSCAATQEKVVERAWEENRVCGGNVELIAISDVFKVSVSFFLCLQATSLHHPLIYLVRLRLKEMCFSCLVVSRMMVIGIFCCDLNEKRGSFFYRQLLLK
jgi:hypothetical protein